VNTGGENMREAQLNTGSCSQKKQRQLFERSQTKKNALAWRVAAFNESLKSHTERLGYSCPRRRRMDRWDPPNTQATG